MTSTLRALAKWSPLRRARISEAPLLEGGGWFINGSPTFELHDFGGLDGGGILLSPISRAFARWRRARTSEVSLLEGGGSFACASPELEPHGHIKRGISL